MSRQNGAEILGLDWPLAPLRASGDGSWEWLAHAAVCNARHMLFGGWILGALTEAAQRLTSAHLRELSVGYMSAVTAEAEVSVRAEDLRGSGSFRHIKLEATTAGTLAVVGHAMTGPVCDEGARASMPDAGSYQDWPPRVFGSTAGSGSSRLLEVRPVSADPSPEARRVLQWIRVDAEVDPVVAVAVVSDTVPSALRLVVPEFNFVPTMTAQLRMLARPEPGWMLLDIRVPSVDSLTATGSVDIWSSSGVLIATAAQTCRLMSIGSGQRRSTRQTEAVS